jgi:branched-chain amino acid transport system permease protein
MAGTEEISRDVPLVADSDKHFYNYFNAKQREYVRQVLNEDIIEEYRRKPLGHHSEPLERTLAYFRRLPIDEQYALKREQDGTFRMIAMSGKRGVRPSYVSDEIFQTVHEGYFAIFVRQIKDMTDK